MCLCERFEIDVTIKPKGYTAHYRAMRINSALKSPLNFLSFFTFVGVIGCSNIHLVTFFIFVIVNKFYKIKNYVGSSIDTDSPTWFGTQPQAHSFLLR